MSKHIGACRLSSLHEMELSSCKTPACGGGGTLRIEWKIIKIPKPKLQIKFVFFLMNKLLRVKTLILIEHPPGEGGNPRTP